MKWLAIRTTTKSCDSLENRNRDTPNSIFGIRTPMVTCLFLVGEEYIFIQKPNSIAKHRWLLQEQIKKDLILLNTSKLSANIV